MLFVVTRQAFRNGSRVNPGETFDAPEGLKCKYAVPKESGWKPEEPEVDEYRTLSELARAEAKGPIKRGPGRPAKNRASDAEVI